MLCAAWHPRMTRYKSQGKLEQALKLCEEALEARRKIYQGDQHSDVAVSMYTLGAILVDTQSYSKAESLLRDSVSLLEMLCGGGDSGSGSGDGSSGGSGSTSHNQTAQLLLSTAMNNLALCLKSKGSYEEAEVLYREVLSTRADKLGPEHQDTMTSMHNLAELYRAIGDEEAAHKVQEELMRAVNLHRAKHS
jgi:tetratricopeptide (TPR) repeat protein